MANNMKISHKEALLVIEKAKKELKKSETINDMCEDYGVSISITDLVPVVLNK